MESLRRDTADVGVVLALEGNRTNRPRRHSRPNSIPKNIRGTIPIPWLPDLNGLAVDTVHPGRRGASDPTGFEPAV